jgi:hypothetical protein
LYGVVCYGVAQDLGLVFDIRYGKSSRPESAILPHDFKVNTPPRAQEHPPGFRIFIHNSDYPSTIVSSKYDGLMINYGNVSMDVVNVIVIR